MRKEMNRCKIIFMTAVSVRSLCEYRRPVGTQSRCTRYNAVTKYTWQKLLIDFSKNTQNNFEASKLGRKFFLFYT